MQLHFPEIQKSEKLWSPASSGGVRIGMGWGGLGWGGVIVYGFVYESLFVKWMLTKQKLVFMAGTKKRGYATISEVFCDAVTSPKTGKHHL